METRGVLVMGDDSTYAGTSQAHIPQLQLLVYSYQEHPCVQQQLANYQHLCLFVCVCVRVCDMMIMMMACTHMYTNTNVFTYAAACHWWVVGVV